MQSEMKPITEMSWEKLSQYTSNLPKSFDMNFCSTKLKPNKYCSADIFWRRDVELDYIFIHMSVDLKGREKRIIRTTRWSIINRAVQLELIYRPVGLSQKKFELFLKACLQHQKKLVGWTFWDRYCKLTCEIKILKTCPFSCPPHKKKGLFEWYSYMPFWSVIHNISMEEKGILPRGFFFLTTFHQLRAALHFNWPTLYVTWVSQSQCTKKISKESMTYCF